MPSLGDFVKTRMINRSDATGSSRGASRSLLETDAAMLVEMPRARAVECHASCFSVIRFAMNVVANLNLHGTSPWHPEFSRSLLVATSVNLHGTSPWHPEF